MAPIRGRGGIRGRGRGRGGVRGRGGKRGGFATARIEDPVGEGVSSNSDASSGDEEVQSVNLDQSSSDEEDLPSTVRPYNSLLQAFQESESHDRPRKKRRKLDHGSAYNDEARSAASSPVREEDQAGPIDEEDMVATDADDVDEDEDTTDPFETHFADPDENELSKRLKAIVANAWSTQKSTVAESGRLIIQIPDTQQKPLQKHRVTSTKDLKLKRRLIANAQDVLGKFKAIEQDLVSHVFDYQDVLFGARTVQNAERLRQITCLHALNHIFKTRDRVIKNNAKQTKEPDNEDAEYRDQGFTRPKLLMLLETRQACVRTVSVLTELCDFEQQENKKRFLDSYSQPEDKFSDDKPEDFRELFEGNDDNEFRIGMKFTRKTVKFFSQFYNSDIILASPLGLRRAIESGDPKKKDSDFLSSIEVVTMDQADAMLMQNWDHVEFVFDHLNLQPKDAHGCDFSRVRSWYLDGHAANLRQTIVLSAYMTPELNRLCSKHMRNIEGRLKYQQEYEGTITHIGLQIKQTFSRYDSPSPVADPDARFKYFTTAIVPSLTRLPKPSEGGQGVLIFIPSYLDFVRIRNYFAASNATQNISFGAISEYVEMPDVRRARSHFMTGKHSVLLYTGRAHHFRRYHIRGVKRVIMYALPDNPAFYQEMVGGYLGATLGEGKVDAAEMAVRVLFSKWDGLRLERIVGSKRVGSMLREKGGDTFDFI